MEKKPFSRDAQNIVDEICESDDHLHFDLYYPRNRGIKHFVIGLMDVRAADAIRVSYDYDRDGYIIEQPSISQWEVDDKIADPGWKEVAFIEPFKSDKRFLEEMGG